MDDELSFSLEEQESAQAKIEARATPANPDTESELRVLMNLQNSIKVPAATKRRYENLRNRLTQQLTEEGARWFLDDAGQKWLGYVVTPERTVLDVEEALAMAEAGELDIDTLELMAPRKANLDGVREALTEKRLTAEQVTRLLSFEKQARYVKYARPLEERDASSE